MATQDIDVRGDLPLPLLKRAIPSATNDEMLELAYQVLENLAERAESAADFAIDSDDRDVENEALVFIKEADEVIGIFRKGRLREAGEIANAAEADIEKAIRNRRAALEGRWTKLEQFSHRRRRRVHDAFTVERNRKKAKTATLVERAEITPKRVRGAVIRATTRHGEVQALDVAIALMPELTDTRVVGRQTVINRVSQVMRAMVSAGQLEQIRPDDTNGGRKTCRYVLAGEEEQDAR